MTFVIKYHSENGVGDLRNIVDSPTVNKWEYMVGGSLPGDGNRNILDMHESKGLKHKRD
jgi:hypothetical protein